MSTLVVTGAGGQLGGALVRRATAAGQRVIALGHRELDIADAAAVDAVLGPALAHGGAVINAAAYTAVDKAESDEAAAFASNGDGPGHLARACRRHGARLVHVSTDYVFDGTSPRAYREDDPIAPLGAYGRSKAAGEAAVRAELPDALIVRTAWVFAATGANFVKTMLRLARERPVLRVVADQHGCPTEAGDLARGLLALLAHPDARGTYHYGGEPATTWHGFAEAIVAGARARGPIACERVEAITTADYPTPARRPANSVLDTSRVRALGIHPASWREGLEHVLEELCPS